MEAYLASGFVFTAEPRFALPDGEEGRGASECRLALVVGEGADVRTFFFAGEDEMVDLACVVAGGAIERFRSRMEHLTVAGGTQLHESATLLWPAEAGDPADVLGVGTWDFGASLEQQFRVVFDRPAP